VVEMSLQIRGCLSSADEISSLQLQVTVPIIIHRNFGGAICLNLQRPTVSWPWRWRHYIL